MSNYYIWTIGCQMNKAESERIASSLEQAGHTLSQTPDDADIIILNSCVVRQSAETRIVNKIRSLKPMKQLHPDKLLAVTGCLVNSDAGHLQKTFPYVNYFFKPGALPPWVATPATALPANPTPTVYIPIIQGCDNFCAYCIVPFRRGREKSRPLAEIVCEVQEVVRRGAKEVTLLGQNVDSYGHDLTDKPDLAGLLEELNAVDGLARIRFLTNHPKDMSDRLTDAIARLDKVCEHLNLPVQSGSNEILQAMRRGYTVEQYRALVARIREKVPDIALSTDVIVGFPSETNEQFQETANFLAEVRFDTVHVAAYSPRPGTIAARELEDNVPPEEKKSRLTAIEKLQEKIATGINAGLFGKTVEVLVDSQNKGKWQGRTRSAKLVFFSDKNDYFGKLVNITIEKTSPWSLQGKIA
jgi:tRNA-2-methylthio-N6-dimethylallyladenosine synthase